MPRRSLTSWLLGCLMAVAACIAGLGAILVLIGAGVPAFPVLLVTPLLLYGLPRRSLTSWLLGCLMTVAACIAGPGAMLVLIGADDQPGRALAFKILVLTPLLLYVGLDLWRGGDRGPMRSRPLGSLLLVTSWAGGLWAVAALLTGAVDRAYLEPAVAALVLAPAMVYVGRALRRRDAGRLLARERRRPILYLRPFSQEAT